MQRYWVHVERVDFVDGSIKYRLLGNDPSPGAVQKLNRGIAAWLNRYLLDNKGDPTSVINTFTDYMSIPLASLPVVGPHDFPALLRDIRGTTMYNNNNNNKHNNDQLLDMISMFLGLKDTGRTGGRADQFHEALRLIEGKDAGCLQAAQKLALCEYLGLNKRDSTMRDRATTSEISRIVSLLSSINERDLGKDPDTTEPETGNVTVRVVP